MLSVPAGALKVPPPENVDLDQVAKTHPLLTDFPPLPSDDLIRTAIKKQSGGTNIAPVSQGTPIVTRTPTPVPVVTGPTATPGFFPTPTSGNFPTRTPRPRPTKPPVTSGNTLQRPPEFHAKGVGPKRPPRVPAQNHPDADTHTVPGDTFAPNHAKIWPTNQGSEDTNPHAASDSLTIDNKSFPQFAAA